MRTLIRTASLAAVCLFALAPSASAQDGKANDRAGLWGGVGFGYGMLGVLDCPFSDCETEGGFSGTAQIGLTISRSFRVAAGVNGWGKNIEGRSFTSNLFSVQGLYFPGANDFFLLGGAGLATLGCDGCDTETGAGLVIGAGYDFPINKSGSLALTPFVNWVVTTMESNPHFLQAGLGLTFN